MLECSPRQFGDLAGDLDAGGAAADDDEREPRPTNVRVALELGHLERAEDPCPLRERVRERLHPGCPLGILVVTK